MSRWNSGGVLKKGTICLERSYCRLYLVYLPMEPDGVNFLMTVKDWDEIKASLEDLPYYPGSNLKRGHVLIEQTKTWDIKPRKYLYRGELTEFFTLGMLAQALNRKPGTIRKWEREYIIPKATLIKGSNDPRGVRRLYTRAQVEGLIQIAKEVGIFNPAAKKSVRDTEFTQKAVELFQRLQ